QRRPLAASVERRPRTLPRRRQGRDAPRRRLAPGRGSTPDRPVGVAVVLSAVSRHPGAGAGDGGAFEFSFERERSGGAAGGEDGDCGGGVRLYSVSMTKAGRIKSGAGEAHGERESWICGN